MSKEDYPEAEFSETGGSTLSSQLGSSFNFLDEGEIDMRILGVLTDPENIPKGMRSLVYLLTYADLFHDEFARSLVKNYLHLTVGIRGRGRRDIIRMESVARGVAAEVSEEIREPGFWAKNIWNRNWEEKEREKLGL